MNSLGRTLRSDYMEWAKLHSAARFNLATSGMISVPAAEFPWSDEGVEITAPGAYGYVPLLERIARHEGVEPDCVVTAAGTSMANHLAMAAVVEPGDEVLIEEPTYSLLLEAAGYLGARIRRFERRADAGFAIDLDEIAAAVNEKTALIVLTNLHNPSGALVSEETIAAIGEIARRHRAQVLIDEVYLELWWNRARSHRAAPFIFTNSLTKAYGLSGLRCGWIIAAPELAHRIWRLNDLFGVNAAHPAEQLAVRAFDHLAQFQQRTQALLETNRPLLDAFLDSRSELECFRPPGGTVVFPRLRCGDAEEFVGLLREKYETSVVPGRFFEMPQHFRIGIGGLTSDLREGLKRIGSALDELA